MIILTALERSLCTPKVVCGHNFLLPSEFGQGFAVEYNNASELRYTEYLAGVNGDRPKEFHIPFTDEGFKEWQETPEGQEATNRAMLDAYLIPDGHAIRAGDFYRFIPVPLFQEITNFLIAGMGGSIPLPPESETVSEPVPSTKKKKTTVIKPK